VFLSTLSNAFSVDKLTQTYSEELHSIDSSMILGVIFIICSLHLCYYYYYY